MRPGIFIFCFAMATFSLKTLNYACLDFVNGTFFHTCEQGEVRDYCPKMNNT